MDPKLLKIFNKACKAIENGEYSIKKRKDCPDDLKVENIEDSVAEWMLASMLRNLGNLRAAKADLAFLVIPKGVRFDAKEFSIEEVSMFLSPQTAISRKKGE